MVPFPHSQIRGERYQLQLDAANNQVHHPKVVLAPVPETTTINEKYKTDKKHNTKSWLVYIIQSNINVIKQWPWQIALMDCRTMTLYGRNTRTTTVKPYPTKWVYGGNSG